MIVTLKIRHILCLSICHFCNIFLLHISWFICEVWDNVRYWSAYNPWLSIVKWRGLWNYLATFPRSYFCCWIFWLLLEMKDCHIHRCLWMTFSAGFHCLLCMFLSHFVTSSWRMHCVRRRRNYQAFSPLILESCEIVLCFHYIHISHKWWSWH